MGIGARLNLGWSLATDSDVEGQFPQPFQDLQQARFGGERYGDDDEIDPMLTRKTASSLFLPSLW